MADNPHLPAYTQKRIKDHLIANGASGTIYAFAFPESREIVQEILDGGVRREIIDAAALRAAKSFNTAADKSNDLVSYLAKHIGNSLSVHRREYTDIFEGAWTGRQDHVDRQFFDAWKKWSAPVVTLSEEQFQYAYPTAGASEGLRECINHYGHQARIKNFSPTIHVFEGEYEGFYAYATAAGIPVKKHNRDLWREAVAEIGADDQFYISQPSAIDGNVWEEFDEFAAKLSKAQPEAKLMLDLTYVGSIAKDFRINGDHPNIPVVFFSLSKPFGVYYHRIGGLLSREAFPSLEGNKWFKNIQAMRTGTALLERSSVYDLPRKYQKYQNRAIENVNANLGLELTPSDVILFSTAPREQAVGDVKTSLLRGALGQEFIRLCITPEIAKLVPGGVYINNDGDYISAPSAINGSKLKDLEL